MDLVDDVRDLVRFGSERVVERSVLSTLFGMSRVPGLGTVLPTGVRRVLPTDWTWEMYLTYLRPDGRVYPDIPCSMKIPATFEPVVEASDPAFRMTAEEIRFFYENGYTRPYTLCTPEEMVDLDRQVTEAMESPSAIYPRSHYRYAPRPAPKRLLPGGRRPVSAPKAESSATNEMSNEEAAHWTMQRRDRHLDNPVVMSLLSHPAVVERVAQILGPDLLIWRSQYFHKKAGTLGTAAHQASHYLLDNGMHASVRAPDKDSLFQLTVWIALSDATIENGCMTVYPGTHRSIRPLRIEQFRVGESDPHRFGAKDIRFAEPPEEPFVRSIEMRAGQFFIFSERVIHGSHPNVTEDQDRRAVNCRFVTPETQIYNPILFERGNRFILLDLQDIRLDRWRAVLVRGRDRARINDGRVTPVEDVLNGATLRD